MKNTINPLKLIMTMNDLLLITIPAAVTSIITYVLTRNKNIADVDKINAEVTANEIDNVEKVASEVDQSKHERKVKYSSARKCTDTKRL